VPRDVRKGMEWREFVELLGRIGFNISYRRSIKTRRSRVSFDIIAVRGNLLIHGESEGHRLYGGTVFGSINYGFEDPFECASFLDRKLKCGYVLSTYSKTILFDRSVIGLVRFLEEITRRYTLIGWSHHGIIDIFRNHLESGVGWFLWRNWFLGGGGPLEVRRFLVSTSIFARDNQKKIYRFPRRRF
jgi:hypothetical protein